MPKKKVAKKKAVKKTVKKKTVKKPNEDPKTKLLKGEEVLRSNRMFINIQKLGCCDAKGKSVLDVGYGRMFAEVDKPLMSLVAVLVYETFQFAEWSTVEARDADLAQFKKFVEGIHFKE